MNTSISNSLISSLNASYQKLAQAQARVQETRAEVEQNRAKLERSQERHETSKDNYSTALKDAQNGQRNELKRAVQYGSGVRQVPIPDFSIVDMASPTVNAPTINTHGQTVGSIISVSA